MDQIKPNSIKRVAEELSQEAEQDKAAANQSRSYLATANPEQLVDREREYRDLEKHWVRKLWLRYVKLVAGKNNRKIKYLALPAYYRLDVSLFHKNELLDSIRGPNDELVLTVAAFETDPTKYARMINQLPPLQLLGLGSIEDALTDKNNKYYSELLGLFPFDVVNLDLTSSLTPQHEGPYSKVMRALEEIMVRQAPHEGEWALFLTFRNMAPEWEETALDKFFDNLQQNLDRYPEVHDIFVKKYGCPSVKGLAELDVRKGITQSVIKWLVDRAHYYGIQVLMARSYCYQRYEAPVPYTITKIMLRFKRGDFVDHVIPMKDTARQAWMNQDLLKCIDQNQHRDVEEILCKTTDEILVKLRAEIEELVTGADERLGQLAASPK